MIQGIATICVGFGETSTPLATRACSPNQDVENEDLIQMGGKVMNRDEPSMKRDSTSKTLNLKRSGTLALLCGIFWSQSSAEAIDFNREIRPILAGKCFACHGPDEEARKAGLRLDLREAVIEADVLVPGKLMDSELHHRIHSTDPDEVMPPPESNQTLRPDEIDLLDQWIEAGAAYDRHWAFVSPQKPKIPSHGDRWGENPIDAFLRHSMNEHGFEPSEPAPPHMLLRRLYLDLTGLPPAPEEVEAFARESSQEAYVRIVDRLLASPAYGEKWGREWLDIARYADTNGYEKDRPRSMWPYRDWVIRSLNADMPFDQFTIEQLAGDMLPGATQDQRIATGFHRNTQLNEEGGIDPLEFRFYAAVDRVATTGTAWMGLTTGCAQCHTHKYDPITHEEYYGLMALLDNVEEPDLILESSSQAAQRKQIEAALETERVRLQEGTSGFESAFTAWLKEAQEAATQWTTLTPREMKTNLPKLEVLEDGSIFSSGDVTKRDVFTLQFENDTPITALRLEVLPDPRLPEQGPGRCYYEGRKGDFFLSEFQVFKGKEPMTITQPSHTYGKISIGGGSADANNVLDGDGSSGWSTAEQNGKAHHLVLPLKNPISAKTPFTIEMLFERHFVVSLGRFRLSATSETGTPIAKAHGTRAEALLAAGKLDEPSVLSYLKDVFLETDPRWKTQQQALEKIRNQLPRPDHSLVMMERPADNPRPTYLRHRGEYLSPRNLIEPGLPKVFRDPAFPEPKDRLSFARWLASDANPMGDRVTVNRAWRSFFGAGLIRTSGNFGTQAPSPDHPELLDWLAVKFRENGRHLKSLHRLIVTSAIYQQSSQASPEQLQRDPENRHLARGPRFRLSGELIRDHMLAASGRLSHKMQGPGVYPPQPLSVTAHAFGNTAWKVSSGEDRYRRSVYTFIKRTAPFASYMTFDGTSGENCLARRDRSNTPLQALSLLNDDMFLELARHAAIQAPTEPEGAIETLFRQFLSRPPTKEEQATLMGYYQQQLGRLHAGELQASDLTASQEAPVERAARVLLARLIMNLDEAITKP